MKITSERTISPHFLQRGTRPSSWEKVEKIGVGVKNSACEASREVVWGGERIPLGSLRPMIFFIFHPVFCLFPPTAEPGLRLHFLVHLHYRRYSIIVLIVTRGFF